MKTLVLTKLIYIAFYLTLTSVMLAQSNYPDWLTNPYNKYPKNSYLVSFGEGFTRKNAEKDALGRMSLIFKSNIKVSNSLYRKYEELISDNDSYLKEHVDASDNIKITSEQSLLNVKFGESFVDENGKFYTLAYIDRSETMSIYNNKLKKNVREIFSFYNKSKAYRNPIQKFAFARAASEINRINENLLDKAKIIDPNSKAFNIYLYSPIEIKNFAIQTAKNISFSVNVINDKNNVIKESLEQFLTKQGFVLRKNPLLKINGIATMELLDLPRKEVFLRWDLTLNIYDKFKNKILSSSKHGREGHITKNECELRCFNKISSYISKEYGPSILQYFDRLVYGE